MTIKQNIDKFTTAFTQALLSICGFSYMFYVLDADVRLIDLIILVVLFNLKITTYEDEEGV